MSTESTDVCYMGHEDCWDLHTSERLADEADWEEDRQREGLELLSTAFSNQVQCITCPKKSHPGNMVNVYDGEYQCQECRWGL